MEQPTDSTQAGPGVREDQGGADITPSPLHNLIKEASESEDYIGTCYDTMDEFLNCGADRGVIIDALAKYIDQLGGRPEFDPKEVEGFTWRNRPT